MMKTTKTATAKMTTKTVTMVVATALFFSAVKAVNADTLLRIDTDLPIDVPSGSDFEFSFNISECSQRGDEYIQVDLYDNG